MSQNKGKSNTRLLVSYDPGSQGEQGFPLLDLVIADRMGTS